MLVWFRGSLFGAFFALMREGNESGFGPVVTEQSIHDFRFVLQVERDQLLVQR